MKGFRFAAIGLTIVSLFTMNSCVKQTYDSPPDLSTFDPNLPVNLQEIYYSYNKWRKHYITGLLLKQTITRHKKRMLTIRKELISKVFHPSRVEKFVEIYGLDWDEYV